MRYAVTSLAFGLGASAAVLKRNECSFEMKVHGGVDGSIGSFSDGQCRVGGHYPTTKFTLDQSTGTLRDDHGRGCIITAAPYQIQCDEGKAGTPGWTLKDGKLAHDSICDFAACPINDNNEWNIYKYTIPDQKKCVYVSIEGDCKPIPPPAPVSIPHPECPGKPDAPGCKKTSHTKPVTSTTTSCTTSTKIPPPPSSTPCPCEECPKKPDVPACKNTCYTASISIPPVPSPSPCPCDECAWGDEICYDSCFESPAPPKPTHSKEAPCPCEECHDEDKECLATCFAKPAPHKPTSTKDVTHTHTRTHTTTHHTEYTETTSHTTSHHTKTPSPSPVCCDDCGPSDTQCKATCYDKAKTVTVTTPKAVKPSCADCKSQDNECLFACTKATSVSTATATVTATATATTTSSSKHGKGDRKRSEQNKVACESCPHGDHDCKATCVTKEVVKEIDVCSSCTQPPVPTSTPSVCCNECPKQDFECHKYCYTKTSYVPHSWTETHSSLKFKQTYLPSTFLTEKTKSFVVSKTKSYVISKTMTAVETETIHTYHKKPTAVPETYIEIHSTLKPFTSVGCKTCNHAVPTTSSSSTYLPPPPPPSPKAPCPCAECAHGDAECHKSCYDPPATSSSIPPPPPPPTSSPCTTTSPPHPLPPKPTFAPPPPPPLPPFVPPQPIQSLPCPCDKCADWDHACKSNCIPLPPSPLPPPAPVSMSPPV
ncbi:Vacuolar protein-sorting protein bro1 [Venturia nashicola]|nr:Vacuolar protein-sorting protein bro1 [Venturia nashicola]